MNVLILIITVKGYCIRTLLTGTAQGDARLFVITTYPLHINEGRAGVLVILTKSFLVSCKPSQVIFRVKKYISS